MTKIRVSFALIMSIVFCLSISKLGATETTEELDPADVFSTVVCFKQNDKWKFKAYRFISSGNNGLPFNELNDRSWLYDYAARRIEKDKQPRLTEVFMMEPCARELGLIPDALWGELDATEPWTTIDDKSLKVLRKAEAFHNAGIRDEFTWSFLKCEVPWNRTCEIKRTMKVPFMHEKVCNLIYSESYFGGFSQEYYIAPIRGTTSTGKSKIIGYDITIRARGGGLFFDLIGAKVELKNIGFSIVSDGTSDEDFKNTLGCNPEKPAYREKANGRRENWAPPQCVDSDGVGYYCGYPPPSGKPGKGGITVFTF